MVEGSKDECRRVVTRDGRVLIKIPVSIRVNEIEKGMENPEYAKFHNLKSSDSGRRVEVVDGFRSC